MKIKLIIFFIASLIVTSVFADKPEWAGKGKPTTEQKEAHRDAKNEMEEEKSKLKEKKNKHDELKGIEKQSAKKSEQMENELDKMSDKGKELEENSKKWWKFWGD